MLLKLQKKQKGDREIEKKVMVTIFCYLKKKLLRSNSENKK